MNPGFNVQTENKVNLSIFRFSGSSVISLVYRTFWIVLLLPGFQACTKRPDYQVRVVKESKIEIDGEKHEKIWSEVLVIHSFSNPWNKKVSPLTSLSMVRDNVSLYFFFEARDEDIVIKKDFSQERDVEQEDRVEMFFSKDKDMRKYYCLEIDALGRTLSYEGSHYRNFNFEWEMPEGYKVASRMSSDGYTVEGAIPLSFLEELKNGDELFFGAYRAEFSSENGSLNENWLTWIDPDTSSPDFHVPASLGRLRLSR